MKRELFSAAAVLGLMWLLVIGAVLTVVAASFGAGQGQAVAVAGPSSEALADIPGPYLAVYRAAAAAYQLDWSVVAALGKVECDHGRDPDPSCTHPGAVNAAGAGGPAQFLAETWRQFGVDANGDGTADRWDPADAFFAAARYLRASGAPRDYRAALFAYNRAGWYVALILDTARRYRAAAIQIAPDRSPTLGVVRAPASGPWLAALPGTGLRCDVRILPDVAYLMAHYGLRATACFAATGHAANGEHPLGLALDAVPADGDWSRAAAAAAAFGWRSECGGAGCASVVREPFRFIGYNGLAGHGDPAHAGGNAHIHFSWRHSASRPLSQAAWVDVFAS